MHWSDMEGMEEWNPAIPPPTDWGKTLLLWPRRSSIDGSWLIGRAAVRKVFVRKQGGDTIVPYVSSHNEYASYTQAAAATLCRSCT